MSRRNSWLRRIVVWGGPLLMIAVLVVAGFFYWILTTTSGARWALVTATRSLDGAVSQVSGNVWDGLRVGKLTLPLPDMDIDVTDAYLQVQWDDLLRRNLHIQDLSVGRLAVALRSSEQETESSGDFTMPTLPIQVQVDRLALGELSVQQDNEPLPVSVAQLAASLELKDQQGLLRLDSLRVAHEEVSADITGTTDVQLQDPWPFNVALSIDALGQGADSMLCVQNHWDALPGATPSAGDTNAVSDAANPDGQELPDEPIVPKVQDCSLSASLTGSGSLDQIDVTLNADGQGIVLDAQAQLAPRAAFPLRDASVDLTLADGSSLQTQVNWMSMGQGDGTQDSLELEGHPLRDRLRGTLRASKLDLGQLMAGLIPPAVLTTEGYFDVSLRNRSQLTSAEVGLHIAAGSMWNEQPLSGVLVADIDGADPDGDDASPIPDWRTLRVNDLDVDVTLGKNSVKAKGEFGAADALLALDVDASRLASFWPDLPGGVVLSAQVGGSVSQHEVTLDTTYTPDNPKPDQLGLAPVSAHLSAQGGWHTLKATDDTEAAASRMSEGWTGQLMAVRASHAGLGVATASPVDVGVFPYAGATDTLLQVGAARIGVTLGDKEILAVQHDASSATAGGHWKTAGQIPRLAVSKALIDDVQKVAHLVDKTQGKPAGQDRGGVKIRDTDNSASAEIVLTAQWDLTFEQALAGTLNVHRLEGDVMVPAEPPVALELQTLALDVVARPTAQGRSELTASLNVASATMGHVEASAKTAVHATPAGGLTLNPSDPITANLNADIQDLGWISLFAGDAMEFGGQLTARLALNGSVDGDWRSEGTINGSELKVIRIDDGMRLLDGRLSARLDDDRVILDELYFPASLRVEPKEWRTAEWVSTDPEAKDGYLRVTGDWALTDMAGDLDVTLRRFPVLQRSDRYAMLSGDVHVAIALPALSITGKVTADAGWFDLDMLGGIASVDGDVVVIRAGDDPTEAAVPMDISMDIEVDLGPRFYLTGFGVNSGLVGSMRVVMVDDKLTGLGALRTRGGAIETYGQRLQLRRGTITFQGDITNPILSIEALRTGQAIEAGVRVGGTAKRPRIDLVSYPDVNDIEKLSWLLFGHGPDESGGDMALLVSVGTSFLGDGEPFYRKFGIDEVSLQSGELGSAGSILPPESVVSGLNSGANDLEQQFISVSKGISRGFTVGIRQALSDSGTVGRVTYRLARGLTAELSVGTINGLALVYRWFSRD